MQNEFTGKKIDYSKLPGRIQQMITDSSVFRSYYFHCPPYQDNVPTPEQTERFSRKEKFFAMLRKLPRYEVKLGYLAKRGGNGTPIKYEQKMVDMLLGLEMVHLSAKGQINHIAIIAGDSDFVPAIKMAKEDGVDVFLFHGDSCHHELLQNADERYKIDDAFIDSVVL